MKIAGAHHREHASISGRRVCGQAVRSLEVSTPRACNGSGTAGRTMYGSWAIGGDGLGG